MRFSKLHGLGNDFLYIDARQWRRDLRPLAPSLCDRHRGVGGDGLLLFLGELDAPQMRVINADGSVPEMCGNGLRCFVKALVDTHRLEGDEVIVQTDAGALRCRFTRDARGKVETVTVDMGRPTLDPAAVPVASNVPLLNHRLTLDDIDVSVTAVGVGNPHMVIFDPLSTEERLALGPRLSSHPLWPSQTNVEFCEILPSRAGEAGRMRCDVYERGCGWTQACGTGATAAVFAGVKLGHFQLGQPVNVELPGGALTIEVRSDGHALMTGPAVHVYDGAVDLPER